MLPATLIQSQSLQYLSEPQLLDLIYKGLPPAIVVFGSRSSNLLVRRFLSCFYVTNPNGKLDSNSPQSWALGVTGNVSVPEV